MLENDAANLDKYQKQTVNKVSLAILDLIQKSKNGVI